MKSTNLQIDEVFLQIKGRHSQIDGELKIKELIINDRNKAS